MFGSTLEKAARMENGLKYEILSSKIQELPHLFGGPIVREFLKC